MRGLGPRRSGMRSSISTSAASSRSSASQHWEPLVRNLPLVRADLNNHNLTLVIDTTREVMFKKQAPIEDGTPTLLRDVSYSLEETALLVLLGP